MVNGGTARLVNSDVIANATTLSGCQSIGVNDFAAVDVVGTTITTSATCSGGGSYGVANQGSGTVTVRTSVFKAGTGALYSGGSGAPVNVGASQLDAPALTSGTAVGTACVTSYKGDYTPIAGPTCS